MNEIIKIGKEYFTCDQCKTTKHSAKYRWKTIITKNTYYLCNWCCAREFKKIKKELDEKYEDNKL
ncbi:hypothetical protein CMI37_15075 [Candidatus Pacearchaeota archaeon]|nr:hypothetical protein [Candidatus Pacearchaeota archaeon]|tara:strand:- start:2305 stop:2499 length:195 start_codon:yes stop_codon:yes gene_type:complete